MFVVMDSFQKIFFHIFVLAGLALSPLYGVLSKEPNFFLAHNSDPNDFIVLIGMVSFVFPLVIAASVTLLLYFFSNYKTFAVRFFVALFATLVLLPFVKGVMDESANGTFIVAGLLGMAFSFVYGKFAGPKLFLNYISPAILFFPILFLFEPKIFVIAVPEFSGADYPMVSVPSDTPVVFILFDEFPLSTILNENLLVDKQAFPNFDRLAGKSHWFRNASADYAWTGHAISSILTGARRSSPKVGTYRNYPQNLFTLLGNDYQVEAYESALRLCPPHICLDHQETQGIEKIRIFWEDVAAVYLNLLLPQPKSFGVPEISQSYKNFWSQKGGESRYFGERRNFVRKEFKIPLFEPDFRQKIVDSREDVFQNFLGRPGSTLDKKFHFLHILFPHQPYRFLSSGKKYDLNGRFDSIGLNENSPKGGTWEKGKWLIKIQYQKLLHQVGYTDYLLGQLLDRLEANNLLDSALFILAADHGVNIKEGGFRRQLEDKSVTDIASVPLFIKLPGQEKGAVSNLPATLLDIFPTLADVLGVQVPWEMVGHSLLDLPSGKRGRSIHDYELNSYSVPEDLREHLLVGVKRKQHLFGNFEGWNRFRLQDETSHNFMDKPVSEFQIQAKESVRVQLGQGSRVVTKPGFLPAIVQGAITGIKNRDEWKTLIAVNGVFRAVSPIIKIDDQEKFLAFLPEIAFRDGYNDVEIYLIRNKVKKGGTILKPRLME